jgi:hypothetical protein
LPVAAVHAAVMFFVQSSGFAGPDDFLLQAARMMTATTSARFMGPSYRGAIPERR